MHAAEGTAPAAKPGRPNGTRAPDQGVRAVPRRGYRRARSQAPRRR